jgi:DNA invertase Pin-like site-specific DNA recombinase
MRVYGYARVSTKKDLEKQSLDRQHFILKEYANKNDFELYEIIDEYMTGKTLNRPEFDVLINKVLREGDVLIVTDLDRLGRNADDVIVMIKNLKKRSIKLCALDTPYLNDWSFVNDDGQESNGIYSMMIDILITLKAHMAEQERLKLSERTKQALASKKADGVVLGRPASHTKDEFLKLYNRVEQGDLKVTEAAKLMNISRNQFYVLKKKYIK